jgi:predicted hotdog family 3-hydroxylacyl-ACP dehydratase
MPPCDAGKLIPHQYPMRMADRLLWCDENRAGAEFIVPRLCPFLDENGALQPVALIEVAAQACAAWQGFMALSQGLPIRQGYLVGVDNFINKHKVPAGSMLISKLRLAADLGRFMVVDAVIENNTGQEIASLRLKVYGEG